MQVPPTLSQGGVQAALQCPQSGQRPSASNGTAAATALDNYRNSQLGDVAGKPRDKGGGPGQTTASGNSAL